MTPTAPGRSSILDQLEIVTDPDLEVDAIRVGDMLFLKDGPTHENMVEQLIKLFPREHVDDITRVVRTHLPKAPSLENLALQIGASTPKWVVGSSEPAAPMMSKKRLRVIGIAVTAGLLAIGLGTYAALDRATASPFETSGFLAAAERTNFHCDLQTDTTAECRYAGSNAMWEVTATEGLAGDPVAFRLWHDADLGTLWIFDSVKARESFPRMQAYAKLYPYMTVHDRFIVAATDELVARNLATAVDATMVRHSAPPPLDQPASQQGWGTPGSSSWPTGVATIMQWPSQESKNQPQEPPEQRSGGSVAEGASRGASRAPAASGEAETVHPSAEVTGTPAPRASRPVATPAAAAQTATATRRPTATPTPTATRNSDLSVTITLPNLFAGF